MKLKVGYLILAHEGSDGLMRMLRILGTGHSRIAIHLDASVEAAERSQTLSQARQQAEIEEVDAICCKWGSWSLVEATLRGVRHLLSSGDEVSHIVLLSGSHFPLRPPAELESFLAQHADKDFIEHHDARKHNWVKKGEGLERFNYRFPINQREHPRLFSVMTAIQRSLGLKRKMPAGLQPYLGSQWWCLRRETCRLMLKRLSDEPSIERFFKQAWIPDECFFQSLAADVCSESEIINTAFVHHTLTPVGRPYVFYNDHVDELMRRQAHFFVRKISPGATQLLEKLEATILKRQQSNTPADTDPSSLEAQNDELSNRIEQQCDPDHPLPGLAKNGYDKLLHQLPLSVTVVITYSLDQETVGYIQKVVESMAGITNLGRMFDPERLDLGERMEELGLSPESLDVRHHFSQQLLYQMLQDCGHGAVVVVDPDVDDEAWQNLTKLRGFRPILMQQNPKEADSLKNEPWGHRLRIATEENLRDEINGSIAHKPTHDLIRGQWSCDEAAAAMNAFVIHTHPRSGSYLLVDLLNQIQEVDCLGEIFKHRFIELPERLRSQLDMKAWQRDADPLSYIGRCMELSTARALGFKLFATHNAVVRDYTLSSPFFRKVILRRNHFDTFISLQRATACGEWIRKKGSQASSSPHFSFDPKEFAKFLKWNEWSEDLIRPHLENNPHEFIEIEYEDVANRSAFSQLCPFLGISEPEPDQLRTKLEKQTTEPLKDLITNYSEMRAYLESNHRNLMPYLEARP